MKNRAQSLLKKLHEARPGMDTSDWDASYDAYKASQAAAAAPKPRPSAPDLAVSQPSAPPVVASTPTPSAEEPASDIKPSYIGTGSSGAPRPPTMEMPVARSAVAPKIQAPSFLRHMSNKPTQDSAAPAAAPDTTTTPAPSTAIPTTAPSGPPSMTGTSQFYGKLTPRQKAQLGSTGLGYSRPGLRSSVGV